MDELTKEQKNILKKVASEFLEEGDLPIYLKLEEIAESLEKIAEKPDIEIPPYPEMPESKEIEFPEVQKVEITNKLPTPKIEVKASDVKIDLSETNDLLRELLDKKQEDIEAVLEII